MTRIPSRCLLALVLLLSPLLATGQMTTPATLNYLVIMTDDQRWDTLWAMPILHDTLIRRGVRFTQAFVTTPLCCPSRASFLSGGFYPHHTGVLDNAMPLGSARKFVDTNTLPLHLQRRGYQTALIGKYLNGYWQSLRPTIPPGWSTFVTMGVGGTAAQKSWFAYRFVQGSSGDQPGTGTETAETQYLTDALRDKALAFLSGVGETPFFLYWAPFAPHIPATPAPGDETLLAGYRYRDRGYGDTQHGDKPAPVQTRIAASRFDPASADAVHHKQLRSLQAVDRAIGAMVDLLKSTGKLGQTVIVFLSDNGYMWGEHGLTGKTVPYDEAIRVPLVLVVPGTPPRIEDALVTANLDVPATIAALAGLPAQGDGLSLLPLLLHPQRRLKRAGQTFAEEVFLEGYGQAPGATWVGLRTTRYKYIEHALPGGGTAPELYDLDADTYELRNQAGRVEYAAIQTQMAARVQALRGLTIPDLPLPPYTVGVAYSFQLTAQGGQAPYVWRLTTGQLPPGLTLDPSGLLSGTPQEPRPPASLVVEVQSASVSPQTGQPHSYVNTLALRESGALPPDPPVVTDEEEDD
jgi:arylsulfatase A-like enzyme